MAEEYQCVTGKSWRIFGEYVLFETVIGTQNANGAVGQRVGFTAAKSHTGEM